MKVYVCWAILEEIPEGNAHLHHKGQGHGIGGGDQFDRDMFNSARNVGR
jgi:hypothetical protein